jgi:hypothetical protein
MTSSDVGVIVGVNVGVIVGVNVGVIVGVGVGVGVGILLIGMLIGCTSLHLPFVLLTSNLMCVITPYCKLGTIIGNLYHSTF